MNVRSNQVSQDLIDAFRQYVPMHIVCDYLKFHKKPTARSWDEIFGRNSSEQELFLTLITEVLCFGRKTVFAYNADDIDLDPLNNAPYTETKITQILKHGTKHHTLFRRTIGERFSAYTFACRKAAFETYILTQDDLTADVRNKYWTPDSEIRLRARIMVTVFDSIIYDSQNNIIFIVVDSSNYSFDETPSERQAELINEIVSICPSFSTLQLIDLFPCIEGIYLKKTEGIIHMLAFECNTGAVRDERLKQGQLDLRNELYHTSGKAAIGGVIRPYKVGVTWHPSKFRALRSELDIEINGGRRELHQGGGVYSCEVRSISTFDDLCFALHRVALYAF